MTKLEEKLPDAKSQPDLIDHIGWDLWNATQAWKHRFTQEMVERGFPWYGEARGGLIHLIGARGIAQADLAAKARMTKQAVQQHLDDLVIDGVVERIPDPSDARRKIVHYTQAGIHALREANNVKRAIEADYRATLGDASMAALKSALSGLIKHEQTRDR